MLKYVVTIKALILNFFSKINKTFGGALLIGGTALGAGMLGLPVETAQGGFFPSMIIFAVCYLFGLSTGLLFLELCLWMPQDSNIISMSKHLLGRAGEIAAWVLYLFLFYTLTVAYVSGGGEFIYELLNQAIPATICQIIFILLFGGVVCLGTKTVDRVNFILMAGLVVSFLFFILMAVSHVNVTKLINFRFGKALLALPIIVGAFSYQGTIPSLNTYLERDPKKVRAAIIYGTMIPFICYIIWQILTLGSLPLEGAYGLIEAKAKGWSAVAPLKHLMGGSWFSIAGQFFAFFAVTTSFLGVSLGLVDFLIDGFQLKNTKMKRLFVCLFIYVPAIILASTISGVFIGALKVAGGIGCVLLLGLLPVLMIWVGRYKKDYPSVHTQLGGGKVVLVAILIFIAIELGVELVSEIF